MAWLVIIFFGIVQGITEFLPISSSGHLTLLQYYSSYIPESLSLNIAVHIGTLLSILYFYRKDIGDLLRGLAQRNQKSIREAIIIFVAVFPTACIGLGVKKLAPSVLTSPAVTGVCLLLTGCVLFSTKLLKNKQEKMFSSLDIARALCIGIVQGFAVLPGLSRSGLTIVTALWLGADRIQAARFSFLISVPAIIGAGLLEAVTSDEGIDWGPLIVASLVSFAVGVGAIYLVVLAHPTKKAGGFFLLCLGSWGSRAF